MDTTDRALRLWEARVRTPQIESQHSMLSLKGLRYHTARHWHLPSDLDILSTRADDSKETAQVKKIQVKN